VNIFKGVPYGASTAGANRFMAPRKPKSWSGIRDAFEYGAKAPQPGFTQDIAKRRAYESTEGGQLTQGLFRWPPGEVSEDCLFLNIWTPALMDGVKRPVMVWLHGGGFTGGSGDWGWTDGAHLAQNEDVVVVSLNHRLNIFGFLALGEIGGAKYADSANVGMLDIVAALEWVRDNVAAFGGDPDCVTVFGQSGGGCKVSVLMAMPAAEGLFHRAINMSGPCAKVLTQEGATQTALQVLNELHIDRANIDQIQRVTVGQIFDAMKAVLSAAGLTDGNDAWRGGTFLYMFSPVVDGRALPQHPFYPTAPKFSAQVPLMIGTTGEEDRPSVMSAALTSLDEFSESEALAKLASMGISQSEAERLIRGYRASRPAASAADLCSAIVSDIEFRLDAISIAEQKSLQNAAAAYMYLFTWESPAFGGKYKSAHSFDMPFVFDNVDRAPGLWGENPDPRRYELAKTMSGAWAAFARAGNPNHPRLPEWKPYSLERRATMLFNYSCELINDPRREDRLVLEQFKSVPLAMP
jgi:para-nitrobenzyl esterase